MENEISSAHSSEQNDEVSDQAEGSTETVVANEETKVAVVVLLQCAEVTSNPSIESILQLAAHNKDFDPVKALLDRGDTWEIKVLFRQVDREGNTVLHLAVACKAVKVVELIKRNHPEEFKNLANTKNYEGKTPEDLLYTLGSRDPATQSIGSLLLDEPANHCITRLQQLIAEKKIDLFAIPLLIISLGFTIVCGFPPPILSKPVAKSYGFTELLSLELPPAFYILVFTSAAFMDSMCRIIILLYALGFLNSFFIVLVSIAIVYASFVSSMLPNFLIKLPHGCDISSSWVLWMLALIVMVFGAIITSAKCLGRHFMTLVERTNLPGVLQWVPHRPANPDVGRRNLAV